MQGGTYRRYGHLLPGRHVRRPAYDLNRLALPQVYRGHFQPVCIRVLLAGKHLAHHDTFQASLHGLEMLDSLDLEAQIGKDLTHAFGIEVDAEKIL